MLSRGSGCRRPRQPACKVPLRRRLRIIGGCLPDDLSGIRAAVPARPDYRNPSILTEKRSLVHDPKYPSNNTECRESNLVRRYVYRLVEPFPTFGAPGDQAAWREYFTVADPRERAH